jgi:hypothetical protein
MTLTKRYVAMYCYLKGALIYPAVVLVGRVSIRQLVRN